MRLSTWCFVIGLLGFAAPQSTSIVDIAGLPVNISGLPTCAQSCLANSTGSANGCSITDIHCLCSSITYINELSCCLEESCSTSDQEAALRFDISLCEQYNVSIPDFIGCSPLQNETSSGLTQVAPTQLSSFISVVASAAASVSTIMAIAPAYTTTGTALVTTYAGAPLLTGSCTSPTIVTDVPTAGGFAEFPWIGCQADNPGCCPFDPSAPGPLTVCPSDYFSTASGCCPSGWSIYTAALYDSQMPCYSSLSLAYAAATIPISVEAGSTPSILTKDVFTLHYALAPTSPKMPPSTIGGIVAGAVAGSAALGALMFVLRHRFRRRTMLHREATTIRSPTTALIAGEEYEATTHSTVSPITPRSKHASTERTAHSAPASPRPELPNTPASAARQVQNAQPEMCRLPVEMPGSTFIHEHHPFFSNEAKPERSAPAVSVTGPGGASEAELYRPPFASVERISEVILRPAQSS